MNFFSAVLAVIIVTCVLAFSLQGSRGIWEPDEGYYLNAARGMVSTGDWLIPQYNLRPFLEKPPMVYWGSVVGLELLGMNEWGARIGHAIWYALTALVVGLLGASLWDRRTGLLAAFCYTACGVTMVAGNIITPDNPLAFWITLSMFFFWQTVKQDAKDYGTICEEGTAGENVFLKPSWARLDHNRLFLGISLGMAILSKGPATFVFMAAMMVFLLCTQQARRYLLRIDSFLALALIMVIGGSWYLAVFHTIPGALKYMIDNQIVGRLFTAKYDRNPAFYAFLYVYVPILLLGTLPWSLSWYPVAMREWHRIRGWRHWFIGSTDPQIPFLLSWLLVPFIIFSLASSRLPLYVLPLFAPLALIAARCWIIWRPHWFEFPLRPRIWIPALAWVAFLLLVKGGMAHWPTDRDTRAFWHGIRSLLPHGRYELVVVNERRHGLSFYSDGNVEWVTTRQNPYPTFVMPEPIEEEIHELGTSAEYHVFLLRDKEYQSVLEMIRTHGATFREVPGPFNHHIIICDPAPVDTQTVRLAAMGDTRSGDSLQTQLGSALYHIDEEKPLDGIFLLGDNISFDGNPNRFEEVFLKPYDALLQNGVRFFAVLGNHDINGGFAGFQMFHPLFNMDGKRYYTLTFKENLVQVFFLDSNTVCNDKSQLTWFQRELAKSQALWKVVAMHHPLYGKTVKYPEPDPNLRRVLEPIFNEGRVNIVLAGHNHMYQRFRPMNGVYHFTAGSGGMLDEGEILPGDPDLLVGEDTKNVALILQFSRSSCEYKAVDFMERVVDNGTIPMDSIHNENILTSQKAETSQ